jgi:hypothetical protein
MRMRRACRLVPPLFDRASRSMSLFDWRILRNHWTDEIAVAYGGSCLWAVSKVAKNQRDPKKAASRPLRVLGDTARSKAFDLRPSIAIALFGRRRRPEG